MEPSEVEKGMALAGLNTMSDLVHEVSAKWWVDLDTGEPKQRNIGPGQGKADVTAGQVSEDRGGAHNTPRVRSPGAGNGTTVSPSGPGGELGSGAGSKLGPPLKGAGPVGTEPFPARLG